MRRSFDGSSTSGTSANRISISVVGRRPPLRLCQRAVPGHVASVRELAALRDSPPGPGSDEAVVVLRIERARVAGRLPVPGEDVAPAMRRVEAVEVELDVRQMVR